MLGLAAGLVAALVGSAAAWAFVTQVLHLDWQLPVARILATVLAGAAITATIGFAGTWRALGQKPATVLRQA